MDGVEFLISSANVQLCIISSLSSNLKDEIRHKLSKICYGAAKASGNSELYTYKNTLNEFLQRYDSKTTRIKKGMIGELLTHVLIPHFKDSLSSINPYFNMEEESIKKAFDLVLRDNDTNELWFSEVKSGELQSQTSLQKTTALLTTANRELKEKLDSTRSALWQNAINGALISIESTNLKKEIDDILLEHNLDAIAGNSTSGNYNGIIISVVYSNLSDEIAISGIQNKHDALLAERNFKSLITFAIQKSTYEAVVAFLKNEVADA